MKRIKKRKKNKLNYMILLFKNIIIYIVKILKCK